ncbi:hypothetical protein GHT06_020365 [Daphnia sinensis]|uniref:Kinase n=1 Tax=Daphnia sinensis TaxID=1820382 RepID=A0AAD5L4C2_9CRUS|nr:hypothetical protein GHT06_020365 [Daphnia sinensis]
MSVTELPDQAVPLQHQIAGHRHEKGNLYTGMLKHIDGYVMKPVQNNQRGKTEIEFYEQVFQSAHPTLSKLKGLIPHFFGLHQFVSNTAVHYYIKMEDIAAGMLKPCIADIKIGRQTWDPYSSPEKQFTENMKYSGTKQPLAFCIPGMSIYDLASDQVLKLDKHYGRSLNSDTVRDALRLYFNSTKIVEKRLLAEILRQLNAVRMWFEEQRHFLFYATSLLLVYDADLLKERSNVLNVRIRMIDFAHVYPAHNSRDANYLEGLCKLIQIISSLQ